MSNSLKQQVVAEIKEKLSELGLPVIDGTDTDIAISTEFVNAKWSTGSKKIIYETAILADVREQIIYMFEKTTESGRGLSFGMSSESSFQSGSTLFRKLEGVHYGPESKAYEYEVDLGAIPKKVKEAALHCGWKFKSVLSRKKASYPASD